MHPFSCLYDLLNIQLIIIGIEFTPASELFREFFFFFFFYTENHGWAMRSWLTAYILCNIISWCNKLKWHISRAWNYKLKCLKWQWNVSEYLFWFVYALPVPSPWCVVFFVLVLSMFLLG